MPPTSFNLRDKFNHFDAQWTPKRLAQVNNHDLKIAKIEGAFEWHHHPDTDELFYIVKGSLLMKFRDGDVQLAEGDMVVVPAGVEHLPVAAEECYILMIEREGTLNTGNLTDSERTVTDVEAL